MKDLTFSIKEDSVGWLEWGQSSSSNNLLTLSSIKKLSSLLEEIEQAKLKALILANKKNSVFCLGADITEIQQVQSKENMKKILNQAQQVFDRFEQLDCFKIAVIQGSCLGGGLELALCCDQRLVADNSSIKIGLPEVQLGLIPGFGGCLRLPRLIGLKKSLHFIPTGKSLNPKQAYSLGLVDELVPELVIKQRALELVQKTQGDRKNKYYKNKKPIDFFIEKVLKKAFCFFAKKEILKKTKAFYPAPIKALELIERSYASPFSHKIREREKEIFCRLFKSSESKNLIRLWILMDQAKKIQTKQNTSNPQKTIGRVGVLGAGVMGRSIAWLFADKGFEVRLIDTKEERLSESLNWINKLGEKQKARGKINFYELQKKKNQISLSSNLWGLSTMDFVIEAVSEDLQLKKNLIANVSKQLKSSCLFASNSSSLSILELAKSSSHPENFFGLHFFNPAEKIPLVEVCLTEKQKTKLFYPVRNIIKSIGKIPVFVKDSPAFLVNRVLVAYLMEAFFLYNEGCDIEKVDFCYKEKFGLPLGPFQLMDKVGIDLCLSVISHVKSAGILIESPPWISSLTQILGQGEKAGQGFYLYNNGKSSLNKQTQKIKRSQTKSLLSEEEIIQRGLFRMINEGKKLLNENAVQSEEDIDLALILGIGFPAFLGGPMNHIKKLGPAHVKKQMEKLEKRYGKRFQPAF